MCYPSVNLSDDGAIAYLTRVRRIPLPVVTRLIERGLLYEDLRGNCVFVAKDRGGAARATAKRGTVPGLPFKGDALGSDKHYGRHVPPESGFSQQVMVAGSAIDAMSVAVLHPAIMNWHLLSLNGAGNKAAVWMFLEAHPEVKMVALGLDSDEARTAPAGEIAQESTVKSYGVAPFMPDDKYKDWNEQLAGVRSR